MVNNKSNIWKHLIYILIEYPDPEPSVRHLLIFFVLLWTYEYLDRSQKNANQHNHNTNLESILYLLFWALFKIWLCRILCPLFWAINAKNTVILPDFLVCKFCGKAQFSHSFGRFARNYAETVPFHKISTPGNQVKSRYFSQCMSFQRSLIDSLRLYRSSFIFLLSLPDQILFN